MLNLRKNISDFALQLCDIPSLSYQEQGLLQFLLQWCEQRNLYVEKIPVSNDEGRFNLLIAGKEHAVYQTIFCTHIDTVPPFIAPRIEHDVMWGRGSCDAKGIAASMVMTLLHEKEQGHDDIAVLLTVGEEEASDGAKECNKELEGRAKVVVVGEPTELKAASAQKGTLVFDVSAEGREAHSSRPELGSSAIHLLIEALAKLLAISWPKDIKFGETLLNVGEIHGGEARNMLASFASAKCIMRLSVNSASILRQIDALLGPALRREVFSVSEPFSYIVPPGFESFVAGFGSDAPYLSKIAEKIMLIGPGSLALAHKPNEHVAIEELHQGCLAYQKISHWIRQN